MVVKIYRPSKYYRITDLAGAAVFGAMSPFVAALGVTLACGHIIFAPFTKGPKLDNIKDSLTIATTFPVLSIALLKRALTP